MKKHEVSTKEFAFSSLRGDWYAANSALPKAFRRHMIGKQKIIFTGFPRQWIPIFEWYGISWGETISPNKYIPFFSEKEEEEVVDIINNAKKNGALRILVEALSMLDPVTSDFLYIMDHTAPHNSVEMEKDLSEYRLPEGVKKQKRLLLNGWQSYGRPSIVDLENKVLSFRTNFTSALVLPCSLSRPYWKSKTHKRIYTQIEKLGFDLSKLHKIVITSLGVLPEELWELPQVLTYDAGVPDIYRIIRLARGYFSNNNYDLVVDCLQFEPYSDVLRIVKSDGFIKEIERIKILKLNHFVIPHQNWL